MSTTTVIEHSEASSVSRRRLLAGAGVGIAGGLAGLAFASPASATTSTGDYFSVKFYGAIGNGTTDDTAAIRNAIAAAAVAGGTVYFPAGQYLLKGTGTELLLIGHQMRLLGDGVTSMLIVDSTVPATTDVIRLSPPTSGLYGWGWIIDGLQIGSNSGTPGRHGINIDLSGTGQFVARSLIQNCFMSSLGGSAIKLTNPSNADGYFTSMILNNSLSGGISLQNAGDSLNIIGNTLTGPNAGIDASFVSGACDTVIAYNNITSAGGAVRLTAGTIGGGPGQQIKILHNQMEQVAANTGPENSMVAVVGTASAVIPAVQIIGNNMNAHGNAAHQIYLDYANYTKIRDNYMLEPTGTAIQVQSTTSNTEIHYNTFTNGQTAATSVGDAGIATIGVVRPVTLVNGWYNPDAATYGPVGATKLSNGLVVCTGVIAGGSTASGTKLFTLPTGLRPSYAHRFVVNAMTGSSLAPAYIDVHANGDVVISSGGNTYVALDSITFIAT